jgi:hypothetical protein
MFTVINYATTNTNSKINTNEINTFSYNTYTQPAQETEEIDTIEIPKKD